MPSIFDRVYAASPVPVQNLGLSTYGYLWRHRRYGGGFLDAVVQFAAREDYSPTEWLQYLTQSLRELLIHAERNVPYYRDLFFGEGLGPRQLGGFSIEDLRRLPVLEKQAIRQAPDSLLDRTVPANSLHTYHTSGTTGTPLPVQFTNGVHRVWSAAYEARCRRWAGVNYRMSRVMIGGRLVVPDAESRPPFWRHNRAERQLYMSAFHISPENAPHYAAAIRDFQPDYLVGYASSHYFLARMILEQALEVHQPRAVLTSSESLTPEMRRVLAEAYGCPVFDGYSGVEACCLAAECEHHRLHLSPDVGIVEILDEAGSPVEPGRPGEIVATGLLNYAQPLIRYRTGDLAVLSEEPCPCGRNMPVIEDLIGRIEDTVIGADGREMVRFHGIFVGLPHIREGQVVQDTLDSFRLRLVVDPAFGEPDRLEIARRFHERLGDIDLTFEIVDRIERTRAGKFPAVISKVRRTPAHR